MQMALIEILHEKCVGCRLCEMICSLSHEGECSTSRSRIKIVRDEEFGDNLVSLCLQCAEGYCVESCPSGALTRDPETGVIHVDDMSCNGCETCVDACPVGAISYDRTREVAFKCDLCGGDPKCVQFCSRGTLTLKDTDIASPERKSLMAETGRLLLQVQGIGKTIGPNR